MAGRKTPQKLVWRARIVLMWSQRAGITEIIRATDKDRANRLSMAGSLSVARRRWPRTGRYPTGAQAPAGRRDGIRRIITMTLNDKPPGSTHWSLRKMAKAVGLSHSSVQRIWATA